MLFRNIQAFRLSATAAEDLLGIEDKLGEHRLRSCGPLEMGTAGMVSPLGRAPDAELSCILPQYTLVAAGREDKLLPGAVIADEVARRISAIAAEGRKVNSRERKRIQDDVHTELLPRAFTRSTFIRAYADRRDGWFIVDSASRKTAEFVVSQVREVLGSFPAVPLAPEESPRATMTHWLSTGELPPGLSLGDECELRDPSTAKGAVSKSRRQDLDSEEIKEHLRNGKQVFSLGLTFDDRISFVLCEDLSIHKVQFLELVMDEFSTQEHGSPEDEARAIFTLLSAELRRLLTRLADLFKVTRPD